MSVAFGPVIPVLRMVDVPATKRFYCEYLGCALDWQEGDEHADGPVYLQVRRGDLVLHLSTHHDDGTPGTAVLVETEGVAELQRELHGRRYPFLLPGIEPHGAGQELVLIDPAANRLRFWERESAA